jgi:hypothetical protein
MTSPLSPLTVIIPLANAPVVMPATLPSKVEVCWAKVTSKPTTNKNAKIVKRINPHFIKLRIRSLLEIKDYLLTLNTGALNYVEFRASP